MTMEITRVESSVLTLEKVKQEAALFSVPSYQRPYIWPDEHVLKLFDDIRKACEAGEPNYYIGTVISARASNGDGPASLELIDGQQRVTTLMLIAIAFQHQGVDSPLSQMAVHAGEPRLQFAIRDQVQGLLGSLAGINGYQAPDTDEIAENEYLTRVHAAMNILVQQVSMLDASTQRELGRYIFSNVQWVNNLVPPRMDLNRIFATMNTAGVQLEPVDILKSRLFKRILTRRAQFEAIWGCCEHMGNYFERTVRRVFTGADWRTIQHHQLERFDESLLARPLDGQSESTATSMTLEALLESSALIERMPLAMESNGSLEDDDDDEVYCRSIIPFPLLLIHTYRIYLSRCRMPDITPRLRSDRLLEIFEPLTVATEVEVKSFLELLWKVRYQFDRWVIKWVEQDDDTTERLDLATPHFSSERIARKRDAISALSQLQSVLNFTGDRSAQYWLTPFLGHLIDSHGTSKEDALCALEVIDNQLSLAVATQKEASFSQANRQQPETYAWDDQAAVLLEQRGTSFEHYWFQKLEYLLWKEGGLVDKARLSRFRITSKNSVEHVFAQHDEHHAKITDEYLHSFGNLVLLSPGENSSYSCQDVDKKQIDFLRKSAYDSLKLAKIFELKGHSVWTPEKITRHRDMMIALLERHYSADRVTDRVTTE